MFQKISLVSAAVAAGMVGIVSIGNAVGRIFWAWVSDAITRRWTFAAMFLLPFGLFWILPAANHVTMLTIVSFVILMCYQGRIRYHARFRRRLIRLKKCRPHLWPHADRLGLRQRLRPAIVRLYAQGHRRL
jgi:hypothetical protein